jgi:hypothetical protein
VERYAGDIQASLTRHGRTESSGEPSVRAESRARYRECRMDRVGNGPVFALLNFLCPGFRCRTVPCPFVEGRRQSPGLSSFEE